MFSIHVIFALICVAFAATTVLTITSSLDALAPHPSLISSVLSNGDIAFISAFISGIVDLDLRKLSWMLGPTVNNYNDKLLGIEQLLNTPLAWDTLLRSLMVSAKNLFFISLFVLVTLDLIDLAIAKTPNVQLTDSGSSAASGEIANVEKYESLLGSSTITIKADFDGNHFVFRTILTKVTGADIVVHEGPTWDPFEVSILKDYRIALENQNGELTFIHVAHEGPM